MATRPPRRFLSEITGAAPWQGMRHWNMESIYEYGARAGFWRLRRAFEDAGIKPTVYGVATALMRSPEQVAAMQESGWEIAIARPEMDRLPQPFARGRSAPTWTRRSASTPK